MQGIVVEEDYTQRILDEGRTRRLRSDMLVIPEPTVGWIGFRDVFEVDGKAVRDRDERLQKLFLKSSPDAYRQAMRIVEEGTRFNLNPVRGGGVMRTINHPLIALKFLRSDTQPRSSFRIDRVRSAAAGTDVVLEFVEQKKPRMIATPDDAAARGVFWINPATGRVSATELVISTGTMRATFKAAFAEQPKLNVWLPVSMTEDYQAILGKIGIVGHATYSNFRQFLVDTGFVVK
jgi:hypothetical protein